MPPFETPADVEERAQFLLRMRARGVSDLRLLRAMELTPRRLFMPQRYADIAARDLALPLGCGQTEPPPSMLAAMIEALKLEPDSRALEIGAGSGYAAALLAQICGELVSVERCQTLAIEAAERLAAFGLAGIELRFADALALGDEPPFDRILAHAVIEPPAERLTRLLKPDGLLVAAIAGDKKSDQRIVRLRRGQGGAIEASALGWARTYTPLVPGLMQAL